MSTQRINPEQMVEFCKTSGWDLTDPKAGPLDFIYEKEKAACTLGIWIVEQDLLVDTPYANSQVSLLIDKFGWEYVAGVISIHENPALNPEKEWLIWLQRLIEVDAIATKDKERFLLGIEDGKRFLDLMGTS